MIHHVILFVELQNAFADKILPWRTVDQIGLLSGVEIVGHGFLRCGTTFAFQIIGNGFWGDQVPLLRNGVPDDSLEQVDVADVIALDDVLE